MAPSHLVSPRGLGRPLIALAAGWLVLVLAWLIMVQPQVREAATSGGDSWLARTIAERRATDASWHDLGHVLWVGRTVMTRVGIGWALACLAVAAWRRRRRLAAGAVSYFSETDDARNLAVLRMATFGTLVAIPAGREEFLIHAGLPDSLVFPPDGLGPLVAALKPDPASARVMLTIWITASLMAAAGFLTRLSTVTAAALAVLVLGVPQIHGKVNHAHHLIWFALLLAASPCGDAWSVDAWIRGRRGHPARSTAYGLPLRFAWLLLGVVYLFPGFWKLWTGGIDWFASDHLRHQIWVQWSTHGDWRPAIDPKTWPWIVRAGALATIVFELCFITLVVRRRTRPVAMVLGLGFHTMTWLTIRIGFVSLQVCYLALVDWAAIADRLHAPRARTSRSNRSGSGTGAVAVVGTLLVLGNVWYGLRGRHIAWPLACYPKFAYPVRVPERDVIEVMVIDPDGTRHTESFARGRSELRTARWVGTITTVLRQPDGPRREAALAALAELAFQPTPGSTLRFEAHTVSVRPGDEALPPREVRPLATITTGEMPGSKADEP